MLKQHDATTRRTFIVRVSREQTRNPATIVSIVGTGSSGQLNRDVTQSSTISQEEVLRSVRSGRVKGWIARSTFLPILLLAISKSYCVCRFCQGAATPSSFAAL